MVGKKKNVEDSLKTTKTSPTSLMDLVNKSKSFTDKKSGLNSALMEDDCGFKFQRKQQSSPTTFKSSAVEPLGNVNHKKENSNGKNEKRRRRKSLIAGNATVSSSGRKSSISINLSQGIKFSNNAKVYRLLRCHLQIITSI
jgi:hypothetical protein